MRVRGLPVGVLAAAALLLAAPLRADQVELLNGIRVTGEIVYETDEQVVIDAKMGGGTARMRFALSKVHAITAGVERRVIHEKTSRRPTRPRPVTKSTTSHERPDVKQPTPKSTAGRVRRARSEVEAIISKVGRTPPEWFDSVPLEYPKTLDLSWPDKPGGPWNANKNVGQYLFSVINENPGRWRSGVRFLHHLLTVHKSNRRKLARVMAALGGKYFDLMQDPTRAAFWYRQAHKREPLGVRGVLRLAECYWRLGSKSMAVAELAKIRRYLSPGMVKLWSDMGELRKAVGLADLMGRTRLAPAGYMAAGDACRRHGYAKKAIAYYQKILALPATGKQKKHIEKVKERARACIEAVKVFDALDLKRVPNGAHTATVTSYAGPITVEIKVEDGRIEAVRVTRFKDKQYFSALTDTPKQIVERQGVKGVDAVTGATITSQAIINAAAKALASAMR